MNTEKYIYMQYAEDVCKKEELYLDENLFTKYNSVEDFTSEEVYQGNPDIRDKIGSYIKENKDLLLPVKIYCLLPSIYLVDNSDVALLIEEALNRGIYCSISWHKYRKSVLRGSELPTVSTVCDYRHVIVCNGKVYLVSDKHSFKLEEVKLVYNPLISRDYFYLLNVDTGKTL